MLIGLIIYIISIAIVVIGVRYYDYGVNVDHLVLFTFCPLLNTLTAIAYICIIISKYFPNLNEALYKLIKYKYK